MYMAVSRRNAITVGYLNLVRDAKEAHTNSKQACEHRDAADDAEYVQDASGFEPAMKRQKFQ